MNPASEKKPLNTLLVGCGLIAQAKYVPAIRALSGQIRLQAVCDTNEELAQKVAKQTGVQQVYTSLSKALKEIRPEVALLCTPPQTHRVLGEELLRANTNLFMEKPLALTSADCQAIIQAAEASKKSLCVSFSQSFTPVVLEAQRRIENGAIGRLQAMRIFLSTPADYMTTQQNHWVHKLPGGVLSETGPHIIHLTTRFLGKINRASLTTQKHQPLPWSLADDYRIALDCEQGICTASLIYTTQHWAAQVDLIGEQGRLSLDLESGVLVHYRRTNLVPSTIFTSALSSIWQNIVGLLGVGSNYLLGQRKDGQRIIMERWLESLRTSAASPVLPAEGLEVARVIEQLTSQVQETS